MNELLNFDKNLIQSDLIYNWFTTELDTFNELNKVDRIIVAVSGGLDSMALFYLLMETNSYDLQIAHVNHNLRPESEGDEKFVEKICDENSISFHSINLDPSTMEKGESVEQWARNHRYTFLKKTAEKHSVFRDIANLSTYIIPRSLLPELPKKIKQQLGFHFTYGK